MPRLSLKRRADGRYCAKYAGKSFYGKTQREAIEKMESYRLAQLEGAPDARIRMRAYASKWLSAYKASCADKCYNSYVRILNDACDKLGDPYMDQITSTDVQTLFNALKGTSSSNISKYTATVKGLLQAAFRDGLSKRDPSAGLRPPEGTSGTHRALEPWEDDIIFQLQDHRLGPAVMMMRYAGLRRGEACYLDIDRDVDFESRTITVRGGVAFDDENAPTVTDGKTKAAQRVIPLLDPVANCLKGRHGLLIAKEDGGMVTSSAWKRAWESWRAEFEALVNGTKRGYFLRRVQKLAVQGIPEDQLPVWEPCTIRSHDFRHSFVSDLYAAGVDIKTTMAWVGHKDMTMVMEIYAHLQEETKREAELKLRQMLNDRIALKSANRA